MVVEGGATPTTQTQTAVRIKVYKVFVMGVYNVFVMGVVLRFNRGMVRAVQQHSFGVLCGAVAHTHATIIGYATGRGIA